MSQGNTPVSAGPSDGQTTGPALYDLIRRGRSFSGHERHCCFLNLRNGRFADISAASGFDFPDDGRAIGQVDWDLDGDLDFWVANRNGPQVRVLLNELPTSGKAVSLRLEGVTCNRDAIGARVEVTLAEVEQPLMRTVRAGDGFLTQSSKQLHVGVGDQEIERVVVRWPGGEAEAFAGIQPGGRYRLVQGAGRGEPVTADAVALTAIPLVEQADSASSRVFLASMVPMPELTYRSEQNERQSIGAHGDFGKPTLINLWASWCRPCADELQEWSRRADELRDAGLRIIALSVDAIDTQNGSPDNARALIDRLRLPFEVGFADPRTVEQLQLMHDHLFDAHQPLPVPASILLDADGRIAALYRGRVAVETLKQDVVKSSGTLESRILASTPHSGTWHYHRARLNPLQLVWKWLENGWVVQSTKYIGRHREILSEHYNFHKLLVLAGNGLLGQGDVSGAIDCYRRALDVQPRDADAHNNLAWLFATHPDDMVRDGPAAVQHAEKANRLNPEAPSVLDTLAAAYAAVGRFDEAITTIQRGIQAAAAAGDAAAVSSMQRHLAKYQAGQPIRMDE